MKKGYAQAGCLAVRQRKKVIRGGSWNNEGQNLRSAYRNRRHPGNRNQNQGFRLALAQMLAGWQQLDQVNILSVSDFANSKNQGRGYVSSYTRWVAKAYPWAA